MNNLEISSKINSLITNNQISGKTDIISYKSCSKKNELVFFIKPEITIAGSEAVNKTIELSFDLFEKYNINITGLSVIGYEYLKKYNIIEEHYGVINMVAKNGTKVLTSHPKKIFQENFNIDIKDAEVYGGFEFLENYSSFNTNSLNDLWESGNRVKLAPGIYCEKHRIDEKEIYILNGFNPFQLSFFTEKDRYIIVFSLSTDTDWSVLRNEMIGITNPYKALKGSLRSDLLNLKDTLKIDINPGQNGVHLSAGPIEALAELVRFFSTLTENRLEYAETQIGRYLISKGFSPQDLIKMVSNCKVLYNNENQYLFDITEEKNLTQMEFLKDFF